MTSTSQLTNRTTTARVPARLPDYVVSVCAVLQNESASVAAFLQEVSAFLAMRYRYFEIVLIDDASSDCTEKVVAAAQMLLPGIRFLKLSRAYGRETGMTAALEHCIGDYVLALDVRTDPVLLIQQMMDALLDGNDVVRARDTASSADQSIAALLTRRATRFLLDGRELTTEETCIGLTRSAVNSLIKIRSKSRSLYYDLQTVGRRQALVLYTRQLRPGTEPRPHSVLKRWRANLRIIISNSIVPLRLATWLGLMASVLNLGYLLYIFAVVLIKRHITEGWLTTSLTQTGMFLMLFLILAVLSEYVGRILVESKEQPLYFSEHERNSAVSAFDAQRLNVVEKA